MGRLTLFIVFVFSLALSPAAAQEGNVDYLHGLNGSTTHTLTATATGQTYGIHVRLPEDYSETRRYPTIYLLDGGITYPLLGGYYRYLNLAGDVPNLIVVGIAYPGNSFPKGNLRGGDFTAPAESAAHFGGGPDFLDFFASDLFAFIEGKYAADPASRILFGQSLGGQFGILAAETRPELFYGIISSNPALHRNLEYFLAFAENDVADNDVAPSHKTRLYVSLASNDDDRFRIPARRWAAHMRQQTGRPYSLKIAEAKAHNHFSAAPEAFRNGLIWIFDN